MRWLLFCLSIKPDYKSQRPSYLKCLLPRYICCSVLIYHTKAKVLGQNSLSAYTSFRFSLLYVEICNL
jgi:hypothetical protein